MFHKITSILHSYETISQTTEDLEDLVTRRRYIFINPTRGVQNHQRRTHLQSIQGHEGLSATDFIEVESHANQSRVKLIGQELQEFQSKEANISACFIRITFEEGHVQNAQAIRVESAIESIGKFIGSQGEFEKENDIEEGRVERDAFLDEIGGAEGRTHVSVFFIGTHDYVDLYDTGFRGAIRCIWVFNTGIGFYFDDGYRGC